MRTKDWFIAGGIVLCAALLVACGGGSESTAADEEGSREEARVEFAECMREHGVDMPDPEPGERGLQIGGPKGSGINPDDPATEQALEECEPILAEIAEDISPQEQEEFKEKALAFSQCMREHGIAMPDPEFDGAGKVTMKLEKGGGVDPNSPAFQEAQEACQDELPRPAGP